MTLHFVVTLKLKTVIKKSNRQLRRSGAGSYPTVTLLRLQLRLHLNLNVSFSSGSSSGKNGLLRGSGSELRLQHPGSNGIKTAFCFKKIIKDRLAVGGSQIPKASGDWGPHPQTFVCDTFELY